MKEEREKKEVLFARPPIVTVLGHVDHGKTSLLDKIRQTDVARKETGGITQKIGAYQVGVGEKKITFIDTPGHQAFSAMRSRGAKVADLVVLVVAADDGVMPQTIESFGHIKAAGVPFLVAINKVDLPGVDVERVRSQLVKNGINLEGHGGEIVSVPVSAKTGQGIEDLLEMILLLGQMNEIKADPDGSLSAIIIESKKDQRGPVGTVIVKNGTLRTGNEIKVAEKNFRVRGMFDADGKSVLAAEPGRPVEVLGFEKVPPVGVEIVLSTGGGPSEAREDFVKSPKRVEEEGKLKLIVKADSLGSLEAVISSLPPAVSLIFSSVGEITESDIFLAQSSGAEIWGFNVRVPSGVEKLADSEHVSVKVFKIIYEFLEELDKRILALFAPTIEEQVLGKAEIIAQFSIGGQSIAGCRVVEGKINKNDTLQLKRGEKNIVEGKISSLRHKKEEINEAVRGEEFGLCFSSPLDFKVGDMLISHRS